MSKIKSIFYISILITLFSACSSAQVYENKYINPHNYIKENENLIYCKSEYNIPEEILFYESMKKLDKEYDIGDSKNTIKSYIIVDVLGKAYYVNDYEFENYNCESIKPTN